MSGSSARTPMSAAEEATAEHPRRKRTPWSLKSIVVDVTGREMSEFQDRPSPAGGGSPAHAPRLHEPVAEIRDLDPVERITPPLSRANGRRYHGHADEDHAATMERHRPANGGSGSPANRPERIYLHYLLLHLDKLSLPALWYLRRQVNEEIAYRSSSAAPTASPSPASPPAPP